MIQLPYSDELNIGYLSRLFDNTSNCYKFFWFKAILERVYHGETEFSYNDLFDDMIIDAWYIVSEFNLRLGPANTTDNLENAVKEGRFREDLYYRINTISVTMPSLSERKEDIKPLIDYFLELYVDKYEVEKPIIHEQILHQLENLI